MKIARTLVLPAMLIASLTAGVAFAQSGDGPRPDRPDRPNMAERFDLNGDGDITRAEVDQVQAERFDTADANGDGAVSFEEFTAAIENQRAERMAERQQAMFEKADANGDGVISFDETGTREAGMFERADADGDGVITEEERETLREEMRERMGERGGKRFPRGPQPE